MLDKARYVWVILQALLSDDPEAISTSNMALLKLRLKDSFDAAATYESEMPRAQFVFFGDTNHSDFRLHEFFYSAANMDRMAKANIRHIFPEMEPQHQDRMDAMAQGRLSAADAFVVFYEEAYRKAVESGNRLAIEVLTDPRMQAMRIRRLETVCDGLRRAHERGMTVHCLDDRKNLPADAAKMLLGLMAAFQLSVCKRYGAPYPIHGKLMIKAFLDNVDYLRGIKADLGSASIKNLIQERSDGDVQLAERMQAVAGPRNAAIIFGAGHGREARGLFNNLGQDRTLRVDLYASRGMYADRFLGASSKKGILPHYYHFLDEDRLVRVRAFQGPSPDNK